MWLTKNTKFITSVKRAAAPMTTADQEVPLKNDATILFISSSKETLPNSVLQRRYAGDLREPRVSCRAFEEQNSLGIPLMGLKKKKKKKVLSAPTAYKGKELGLTTPQSNALFLMS